MQAVPFSKRNSCPVCSGTDLLEVFQKQRMPRYNLERHLSHEAALQAAARSLSFQFCLSCYFCFNATINPEEMDYGVDYESSRGSSALFRAYLRDVARSVQQALGVETLQNVVEIGCGDGTFLTALREEMSFNGVGYDPSSGTDLIKSPHAELQFRQEYFRPSASAQRIDLMVLRHVLEHQNSPGQFLSALGASSTQTNSLYLEVPAWEWIAHRKSCYVFSYEHCSYFSRTSLRKVLVDLGFSHHALHFGFGDEYLQAIGSCTPMLWSDTVPHDFEDALTLTQDYVSTLHAKIRKTKELVAPIAAESVLWGAAGRGTNFLNTCDFSCDQLQYVIDANPRRTGTFIPLTGQSVQAPSFLKELRPRYVFITNDMYAKEIAATVKEFGVKAELISIETLKTLN